MADVADRIGSTRQAVWRWEELGARPGLLFALRLAELFETDVESLFGTASR